MGQAESAVIGATRSGLLLRVQEKVPKVLITILPLCTKHKKKENN